MCMQTEFLSLLLITLLAVIMPVLASRFRRFRLPIVVSEIIAGIIIGKSGLNIVPQSTTLDFLAQFGFTLLMFLSGLEVNFGALTGRSPKAGTRARWKQPVPLAFLNFGGTLLLALLIGLALGHFGLTRSPILMGLILSTTSLGIVVPILKERELTSASYGQILLIAALVSDFVTLLLLSLVIAIISKGISLNLLLFMVFLLAFVLAARVIQWFNRLPLVHRAFEELSHATAQIHIRGAFALMVMWIVLAEMLGVEVILGAFLAGALVSIGGRGEQEDLRTKLDAIGYGFFIPIFFINVGANFDLPTLLKSPAALVLLPILIVAGYLVKFLPALLFRVTLSWRETLAAGALLSSRLSLIIAASSIAYQLGMITSATNSAVILMAILSCTLSPLLFNRILPPARTKKREGVVILGTDQLAILLGQRLRANGEQLRFIGNDQENLDYLAENGYQTIRGNPADVSVLEQAGVQTARALIGVTVVKNILADVCRLAVEQYQVPAVIARTDDSQTAQELESLGVRVVHSPMAIVLALEVALEFPTAFSLLMNKEDGVEAKDIRLRNPALVEQPLRKIRLPGNALVIGVQRGGEVIVPHGDTLLNLDDHLLLLGSPDCLIEATQLIEGQGE